MAMPFRLFGSSSTTPSTSTFSYAIASALNSSSSTSTTSSSSSTTAVVEKDLLTRLSDSNFEDSGVNVNLTLALPTSIARKCCICEAVVTPLWRNGPKGPKSACNACGIKYRKKMLKLSTNLALSTSPKTKSSSSGVTGRYRA